MTDKPTPRKIEAAFQGKDTGPPALLRVDEDETYVVEWVRNVRHANAGDEAPDGWLVVTIEAYSQQADETLTASFVVAPRSDDPDRPDWETMRPVPSSANTGEPAPTSRPTARPRRGGSNRGMEASALERPGVPSWRRAACLGCQAPVVRNRDAHNIVGGTISGSWLVAWPSSPEHMAMTGPVPKDENIYLLGACHRACLGAARELIRSGRAHIDEPLIGLTCEDGDEGEYNLHIPADDSRCLFCNATEALTDEHVWPQWLSRELHSMGRSLAPRPGEKRARTTIDVTVPVCRPCNNEWLSTLENDVAATLRPMLRGEYANLSGEQQLLLATWATKMAFLIDRISDPVVPRGFPMELAVARRPPHGVTVFLGAYRGGWAAYASRDALHVGGADGPRPDEPNGFVSTFTACKVAFQVVGHFTKGDMEIRRPDAGALLQLWPTLGAASWPPEFVLTDGGVESLAATFAST